MALLMENFRQTLRRLLHTPLFTAAVVLTLALGIAASIAVFTVTDQVLLRPLPLPHPEELVRVQEMHSRPANLTGATFHDLRERASVFLAVFDYRIFTRNLTDAEQKGFPEQVDTAFVSSNFFSIISTSPKIGRRFEPDDFRSNAPVVVLLSDHLWRQRFGGDRGIVGHTIHFNGRTAEVTGVMPPGFAFPENVQVWAPLTEDASLEQNRRAHLFTTIGRLDSGVGIEEARTRLHAIGRAIDADNHDVDSGMTLTATDLRSSMVADARPALLILLAAVGLVLLIACANAANLLLARGVTRQKDLAIRAALGATRLRLLWELISETGLLGIMAGALGLVAGELAVRGLAVTYPDSVPRLAGPVFDWRVALFAVAASCSSALIAGVVPAWQFSHLDPVSAMSAGARKTASRAHRRTRSALLISELALAVVLLAGAGLLIRSFARVQEVDPGYRANNLAVIPISLPNGKYDSFEKRLQFVSAAREILAGVPGVISVAATGALPLRPVADTDFELVGKPVRPGNEPVADVLTITPEYLQTMQIPLLAGRSIASGDVHGAPTVVLINQAMASQYYPGENPIGQQIIMKDWGDPLPAEIIGVVGSVRQESMETTPKPAVLFSYAQFTEGTLVTYLLARTTGNPAKYTALFRQQIWRVDPEQPVQVSTMEEVLADSLAPRSFTLTLLASFAALALLLAILGVYGLFSYSVSQRRREFGIRLAVGAQRSDVLRMVMLQGLGLAVVGLAIGVPAALALTRSLQSLLFGVGATDPLTFVAISFLLLVLTSAACFGPAYQATAESAVESLRAE